MTLIQRRNSVVCLVGYLYHSRIVSGDYADNSTNPQLDTRRCCDVDSTSQQRCAPSGYDGKYIRVPRVQSPLGEDTFAIRAQVVFGFCIIGQDTSPHVFHFTEM